jgi:hypothetical protein
VIDRAVHVNNMADMWIDCIPDGLQCRNMVWVLADEPRLNACTEPFLIHRYEFLLPVVIVQCAVGEVQVCVLHIMLRKIKVAMSLYHVPHNFPTFLGPIRDRGCHSFHPSDHQTTGQQGLYYWSPKILCLWWAWTR